MNFLRRLLSFSSKPEIDKFNVESSIPFTFPVEYAKCVSVYDGDTITILFNLTCDKTKRATIYRHSVRINGIDCPEMRTKNPIEKQVAEMAKKRVEELVLNKTIKLENVKNEKFGRILATVKVNGIDVATTLLNERLAVPYDGKTKNPPKNWIEFNKNKDYADFIVTETKHKKSNKNERDDCEMEFDEDDE